MFAEALPIQTFSCDSALLNISLRGPLNSVTQINLILRILVKLLELHYFLHQNGMKKIAMCVQIILKEL